MTTNLKKILWLTGLIGVCSILAVESIPPKTMSSKILQSKFVDTRQLKFVEGEQLTPSQNTSYKQSEHRNTNDASAGKIKTEAQQKLEASQCTLSAIHASTLDTKSKRELRGFIKAFNKKETQKLVKLQSKMQRVLNTDKGRERYYKFYSFIADLFRQERHLFCDSDPFTVYLQFVEQVIEGRNSLTTEDIDSIVEDNIALFSSFSVLEYFILIISIDIKFGEDITLALLQKLNANPKLQHQPLSLYSGTYWMLLHSFNISSDKSREIVWRAKQLQFVVGRFENIIELPESNRDRRRLLVFMIVASYQINPDRYSVSHFFEKFIGLSLSVEERAESVTELANVWLYAMRSINSKWLTEEQSNEILFQFVDYARKFSTGDAQTALVRATNKKVQEELLWLMVESGQGNRQAAIIFAIEILSKRGPDSERLSRYLLERAEQLGQDGLFLEQIDRLIGLYPEDYTLNTRRYSYQKDAELLTLADINQYLQFLNDSEGMEDQATNEALSRQELSLLQDRADYYLNSKQYNLAEVDRVQIYERSPNLENLTELGEVYNLNDKPEHFVALFDSQISLFGMLPNELNGEFIEQNYDDDFIGFLLTVYSVYADSLEGVGDSERALFVRRVIKRINGGLD